MRATFLLTTLGLTIAAHAQWTIQDAHTTASLRGIHSVGNGIAWTSGTEGTVLRTEDNGKTWQHCATPPNAEKLDFRGIQAFDNKTAIVMSSGKGDLSRIYKTTDGCQTWKLVFTNPDEDGFFDALKITKEKTIYVLGDPVHDQFAMFFTEDGGETWLAAGETGRDAAKGEGAFAASNSSLTYVDPFMLFSTGAGVSAPPHVYRTRAKCVPPPDKPKALPLFCTLEWTTTTVPLSAASTASGVFSLAARMNHMKNGMSLLTVVATGGSYEKPDDTSGTSATSDDGGQTWALASTPPHGYRSAVAYDTSTKTWITVGPNGTDISTDDGRNWHPLTPGSSDTPDADKNWNALSLPFVVGPHGRIGILRDGARSSHK